MYHCVIEQLQNHIAQNGQQLTSSSVEDFLDGKYKNGGSRREFNTYLIVTRSFCNWRQRKYEIESPVHKIPFIKEDPPKQRVLSEEEYQLCLKNTRGMDNDIIQFFGNTGLRKSEFANLKWDNINQQLKFICITGKGRKQRIIPLNETCREVLKKYSRLTNNEFVQFCQRYPGTEGASWMCRKIAKKIGIPKFGVHAIRHYFATELIRKGISIYKVSQVLGHSSVITTEQIYIHLMPVDLLGITDVLD
jgi:integrase